MRNHPSFRGLRRGIALAEWGAAGRSWFGVRVVCTSVVAAVAVAAAFEVGHNHDYQIR